MRWRFALIPVLSVMALTACSTKSSMISTSSYLYDQEPSIRVLIIDDAEKIVAAPDATPETWFSVEAVNGRLVLEDTHDFTNQTQNGTTTYPAENGRLIVKNVPVGVGWEWETKQDRSYDGQVEFHLDEESGRIDVIVQLPVEEYLRGVVPSEIGPSAPPEAMKAQAVAARSETITALREGVYAGKNYDICSDVECQVYAGTGKRNEASDKAIRETRGLVVSYDGNPLPAYYASNSGGHTEDIRNVWPSRDRGIPVWEGSFDGAIPDPGDLSNESIAREWILSRPAVYANRDITPQLPAWTDKNFRWTVETSAEDLTEWVAKIEDVGRIVELKLGERGPSARLKELTFVGEKGEVTIGPELSIRRVWSPPIRSSAIVVETEGPAGRPEKFIIRGAGYGHGVGLCQTGAMARAYAGQDFIEILTTYYRETEIIPVYK